MKEKRSGYKEHTNPPCRRGADSLEEMMMMIQGVGVTSIME
jgi:hypothetical protein